ncbi:pentapeptide repeat-containing protein [Micromonospora sp. CPCC 206171]|uniref:pentapeptide repeat-containing protein n=1 Tax=Micromonospora sp. CPCC 206171 TaxID=3122405 RepID=UPI002FF3BC9F
MDKVAARNATRQVLLTSVGGLALIAGLAFTARTYQLTRRGQITDRYNKGIALLASEKITERLGGIYALEHVMLESEDEHETIVAVLSAFIRDSVPVHDGGDEVDMTQEPTERPEDQGRRLRSVGLATDVQAALTVLGRRPERFENYRLDLCATDLRGARMADARWDEALFAGSLLTGADLRGASLRGCELRDAFLDGAILEKADLGNAYLAGASLVDVHGPEANFSNTILRFASLADAALWEAKFSSASMLKCNLENANLTGADFSSADLSSANLNRTLLAGAIFSNARLGNASLAGANFIEWDEDPPLHASGLTPDQLVHVQLDDIGDISEDLLREARQRRPIILAEQEAEARRVLGDAGYEQFVASVEAMATQTPTSAGPDHATDGDGKEAQRRKD